MELLVIRKVPVTNFIGSQGRLGLLTVYSAGDGQTGSVKV